MVLRYFEDNTNLEIVKTNGILHILDRDIPETKSITNAASDIFFRKLRSSLSLPRGLKVYLYHTDGVITEWKEGNFHYIHYDHPEVFTPYMEKCKERRKKSLMVI